MFQDGYIFKECTSSFTFSVSATRMTFIQKTNDSDIFNGLYFQLQYQSFAQTQMNSGKTIITKFNDNGPLLPRHGIHLEPEFGGGSEKTKKKTIFTQTNWAMKKTPLIFHWNTGCLIGLLIVVYFNPHIAG